MAAKKGKKAEVVEGVTALDFEGLVSGVLGDDFVPVEPLIDVTAIQAPDELEDKPTITEIRNSKAHTQGLISLEALHAVYGWIPFAYDANCTEKTSLEVGVLLGDTKHSDLDTCPTVADGVLAVARSWRNEELQRADKELLKAEDEDPSAVGTPKEWRAYRIALRNWPEAKGFPKTKPKSPDGL